MKTINLLLLTVIFFSCSQAQEKPISKSTESKTMFEIVKTDQEWKQELEPEAYKTLCGGETERAFTGKYLNHKAEGTYACAACKNPLFSSATKFDSGSGWPSFFNQIDKGAILEKIDNSYGMKRIEILCAKCGGHLAHVFEDGPAPTGLRYCVNSVALGFMPLDSLKTK